MCKRIIIQKYCHLVIDSTLIGRPILADSCYEHVHIFGRVGLNQSDIIFSKQLYENPMIKLISSAEYAFTYYIIIT